MDLFFYFISTSFYNARKDLDLEISELLSLSVSGKGTVNFDEIEVINLGNPLETETTVSDGKYVADGNYVFAPYGALIQNGKACNKNADGSFTVSNGSLTKKLYYKSDTGLSVYKVETVERGDETLFFNKQPGMIFSIYVEDYSPSNEYGALVIRNASEATLQKIDNNVKIDMVKTFFNNNCNGWKEYSVYGTAVSFSVIENEQSTKSGNDFCQFDVKVYGNLDKNTEKDGVPYKDMKVSVSAYKISQNNYSFSENFKSAAYSGNIFSEISYNEVPSVTNHTGTGGILPLFWQYGDDENGWYTYTPEQLNACVQQLKYLNVSIVRCFAFQPGYAWNAETNTWNWNTKYMRAFYEYAKTMYENGIEIIINTTAGVASGSQCGEPLPTGLGTTDAEVYPKFVEAFIKNVVNGEGLPNEYSDYAEYLSGIQYFMYATEPNNGDDTENENYDPATSNRLNNYKRVIQETHKYLTGVGLRNRVKLIGPNTVDISKDARTVKWAVENIDEYIDIYAAHSAYSRVDDMKSNQYHHWQDFNRICQSILLSKGINKPFWHDEYNIFMINAYGGYDSSLDNALRGTQLATAQISMMQNGASSSLLWTLFDFKWTNSYRSTTAGFNRGFFKFGLAPSVLEFAAPEDAYVYAPYYAYSALGTAIKSGDTVYSGISTEDGIYTALLKHKNGKYSIVAVNNSSEAVAMKINLPDDANGYYTHILYDPFGNPETGYNTENYSEVSAVDIISSAIGAYQVAIFNLN